MYSIRTKWTNILVARNLAYVLVFNYKKVEGLDCDLFIYFCLLKYKSYDLYHGMCILLFGQKICKSDDHVTKKKRFRKQSCFFAHS